MAWGDQNLVQHLVCPCNSTWGSILPAPPCPHHSSPNLRWDPDVIPYVVTSDRTTWYPTADEYVGRHRKAE